MVRRTWLLLAILASLSGPAASAGQRTSGASRPASADASPFGAPTPPPASGAPASIKEPARRAPARAGAAEPPSVDARVDRLSPATLTVTIERKAPGGTTTQTQTVVRSRDRLLIAAQDGRSEWLFVRNPVDGRRATGYLIDHGARRIVVYDDTELRTMQQIRGWTDVVSMRIDAPTMSSMTATGDAREQFGKTFRRLSGQNDRDGLVEVWWSDDLQLAASATRRTRDLEVTTRVETLRDGGDVTRLALPHERFRAYKLIDVVDLGEH